MSAEVSSLSKIATLFPLNYIVETLFAHLVMNHCVSGQLNCQQPWPADVTFKVGVVFGLTLPSRLMVPCAKRGESRLVLRIPSCLLPFLWCSSLSANSNSFSPQSVWRLFPVLTSLVCFWRVNNQRDAAGCRLPQQDQVLFHQTEKDELGKPWEIPRFGWLQSSQTGRTKTGSDYVHMCLCLISADSPRVAALCKCNIITF